MATTSATGNQGSTGDQDPEPQQETFDTAVGIRPPATAKAGDAGRRLVQEYTARDQADQGPAKAEARAANTRTARPGTPPTMPGPPGQGAPEAGRRSGPGRIV